MDSNEAFKADEVSPQLGLPVDSSLVAQALEVLLDPVGCWPKLRREGGTIDDVYRKYVIPMAAIGPVCTFIGNLLFHGRFFGGIFLMALTYFLSLGGIYLGAMIIEKVAEFLGGRAERLNAFKTLAYAGTPGYVAGVLHLIPSVFLAGVVSLISLYGFYLHIVGLPQMVDVAPEKKWAMILLPIGIGVVIAFFFVLIFGSILVF